MIFVFVCELCNRLQHVHWFELGHSLTAVVLDNLITDKSFQCLSP